MGAVMLPQLTIIGYKNVLGTSGNILKTFWSFFFFPIGFPGKIYLFFISSSLFIAKCVKKVCYV